MAGVAKTGSARLVLGLVFMLSLGACVSQPTRKQITFAGTLKAGGRFDYPFGKRFTFALEPQEFGWSIAIHEQGRTEYLSRLTPPLHFVPNPTDIEGWHFRNEQNTGPNEGDVNAPQEEREFIFSPEVGRSIQGPSSRYAPTPDEIARIESFGRGLLHIQRLKLSPPERGRKARILEIQFRSTISWPREREKS